MDDTARLQQIRESERNSHIAMYSDSGLYKAGGWLRKPIKTVLDILPYFDSRTNLRVLDLGCGVGRNCISVAQHFQNISCDIDCIDILDLAIQKLMEYAEEYHVADHINPIVNSIDTFSISRNKYDWIMAISSLEHVASNVLFTKKLEEIRDGIREQGIVCLVINTNVSEYDKITSHPVPPQFEVNLPTEELLQILLQCFDGWEIQKFTQRDQTYDIPRDSRIHELRTTVITFVARKC